jgi:hypothetical protein
VENFLENSKQQKKIVIRRGVTVVAQKLGKPVIEIKTPSSASSHPKKIIDFLLYQKNPPKFLLGAKSSHLGMALANHISMINKELNCNTLSKLKIINSIYLTNDYIAGMHLCQQCKLINKEFN